MNAWALAALEVLLKVLAPYLKELILALVKDRETRDLVREIKEAKTHDEKQVAANKLASRLAVYIK